MNKPADKWGPEIQALIDRFMAIEPPDAPFLVAPWAMVVDPARYHETLRREILAGPQTARARQGSLRVELERYVKARSPENVVDKKP